MFQLIATPSNALADEPVSIRATGLPPSQIVTIKATLKDEKENLFQSKAFYQANEAGEVDLEQASALGGDYVGVHPMGLFWSLKPKKVFQRLIKKDMNSPFCITLDLYDSVCLVDSVPTLPKASQIVQRWFAGPGVQREQIREGRVRGALFLPSGEGPFPGIIDLFGSFGGLIEFRAGLLASHGFAVLALAYFAYEDLPGKLVEENLDYFEEAANFLLAHPKICGSVSCQTQMFPIATTVSKQLQVLNSDLTDFQQAAGIQLWPHRLPTGWTCTFPPSHGCSHRP